MKQGTSIQYAVCILVFTEIILYIKGIIALPHNPITSIEDPIFVSFPNPLIAKGQMPAYINAFGSPINIKNQIDILALIPKIFIW